MSIPSAFCYECGAPQVIVLHAADAGSWCAEHSPVIICEPSHDRAPQMEAALREIVLLGAVESTRSDTDIKWGMISGWQSAAKLASAALGENDD